MDKCEIYRKALEISVDAGGFTFTVERPSDEGMLRVKRGEITDEFALIRAYTIGWNLKDVDVIPGGGPEPAPFDRELFSLWVSDHPEVWEPLCTGIIDAYKAHTNRRSTAEKN